MASRAEQKNKRAAWRKMLREVDRDLRRDERKRKQTIAKLKTLFDPIASQGLFQHEIFSYRQILHEIDYRQGSKKSSLDSEANAFLALTEDEHSYTGWLNHYHWWAGDLQYANAQGKKIDLARAARGTSLAGLSGAARRTSLTQSGLGIPDWVEADTLDFRRCGAQGILLIENPAVATRLLEHGFWRRENLLLVCSGGLPVVSIRRLLHRLEQTYRLPTYLLTDNDTWGYFFVSILKRGMTPPNLTQPPFAVQDVRFLGIRAFDYKAFQADLKRVGVRWRAIWDARLAALRKTPFYRSAAWRDEFRQFKRQNAKVDALALLHPLPRLLDFLSDKIRTKNWLT